MILVCCHRGCGIVYGVKEPLANNKVTPGLCPKHFEINLKELNADLGKRNEEAWLGDPPVRLRSANRSYGKSREALGRIQKQRSPQ